MRPSLFRWFVMLVFLLLPACQGADPTTTNGTPEGGASGASRDAMGDATPNAGQPGTEGSPAGGGAGQGHVGRPDAGPGQAGAGDAGVGGTTPDAGGAQTTSCCATHAAPGCADPDVEACVCAPDVLPHCCTDGWDASCVEVVRQRYCDPGVRACVCETWEQNDCCESRWTENLCDRTAELKCAATIGC